MKELYKSLAEALVKFQGEVPVIPKNKTAKIITKTGSNYQYSYADLADIWEAIRKPLLDNGLAVTQQLASDANADYIVTKIWHTSGETDSEQFAIPTNGKTPQEVGSVITYYKRYALGAALGISTEEDDDGASGNKKPIVRPATNTAMSGGDQEILAIQKSKINDELTSQNYITVDSKRAFIKLTLGKETIDSQTDANLVEDALENNK